LERFEPLLILFGGAVIVLVFGWTAISALVFSMTEGASRKMRTMLKRSKLSWLFGRVGLAVASKENLRVTDDEVGSPDASSTVLPFRNPRRSVTAPDSHKWVA
jgi:hypothetical protein